MKNEKLPQNKSLGNSIQLEKVEKPAPSIAEVNKALEDSSQNIAATLPSSIRRGRPAGSSKQNKEIEQQKDELYTPEVWGPVAALPYDIMHIYTKYDGFVLSKEDQDRHGLLLAKVMRIYSNISPEYVILGAFLIDYLSDFGKRVITWKIETNMKEKSKESQK